MVRKLSYTGLIVLCFASFCRSQSFLQYSCTEQTSEVIERFQPLKQEVQDSLAAAKKVNLLQEDLYEAGYLTARFYPLLHEGNTFTIRVNVGERYQWAQLKAGNVPELLLSKTGFRERFYTRKPFRYNELARLLKKIIIQSENTGYPFSSVGLDSIEISGSAVAATLRYSAGPLISYDSLVIEGTSKVKASWLAAYLGVTYGAAFSQQVVDKITSGIEKLSFLELTAPPQVTFQNSQARILLKLKDVEANRIDGIVGFLPNAQNNNKLLVTGQFNLDLANLFNSGKSLSVVWQRLKPLSQFLLMEYDHPNLFGSQLNLHTSFQLLKEDTTFINRDANISFNYHVGSNALSFFTKLKTSRLLGTSNSQDITSLPEVNDFNLNYYGIGYDIYKLNFLRSPRSGMAGHIDVAAGGKKIKRNASFPAEVYEKVNLRSVQYQLETSYQYYVPLSKVLILHQKLQGGKIINDRLFLNDLFRIGGLKTLRGFNENFFFASDYAISNLELQLYYSADSYLFVFYDQSYLYFNIGQTKMEDYPLGLGAGINFSTGAGVVSLAYAVGRSREQPLSLRLSKFHFGYIAKF